MATVENIIYELEKLESSLYNKKLEIESGVDILEEEKKTREMKKKEILLHEMKQIVAKMNEIDKKVVKDLKGEAFDIIRSIRKVTDKITVMKDSFKDVADNRRGILKTEVKTIKAQVDKLEIEEFVKCLNISVSIQPGSMAFAFERIPDAIFLDTPFLKPKDFCLEVSHGASNYVEVKIHNVGENTPASLSSPLLLRKLVVTVKCHLPGEEVSVLEECSIWSKLEKKKAVVSEDGENITVQMKRPHNMFGKISVDLLGSNILNSPMLYKFSSDSPAPQNYTHGNADIGIFNITGLDQSDINSLDLTARQQKVFPVGKHLLSNPTLPESPAYQPPRKVSRQPNVSAVPELSQTPNTMTNTLPFSPCRGGGMVSTMRATATFSQLSKIPTPENSKVDQLDESNLSILVAPCKTSALSIDDMQRSLSGSESGSGDKSMVQLDRSVRFAPQTQVVEILSTPQVRAGDGNRFSVAHGQTKSSDGQAGPVRRLIKNNGTDEKNDIWDITELDTEEIINEEHNPASAVTLPIMETSQSCNANKSQSACANWADSIWESEADFEKDCDDNEDDEEYNDHPHLLLNASKAPEVGADWPSVDPSWDLSASLLPPSCFNKSVLQSPASEEFNQTIWESDSLDSVSSCKFDIHHGSFEVTAVYETHPVSSTISRGTKRCLISPHSISYLPYVNYFLVTEPDQNRVGLYEADTFQFHSWLEYPQQYANSRQNYTYPTSILSLSSGCIVLIERNKLHVFDRYVRPLQAIPGVFHGLTEGPNRQILTLGRNKDGQAVIKKFVKTRYRYKWAGQVFLRVIQEFENWETLSKARFLLYNQGKVFITDEGLHKMYIVDLDTGKQVGRGYLGSDPGQFKHPTGILADDMGDLLVGDSGNNRLGVYTSEGKFVKVVGHVEWRFSSPQGLVRVDNTVYAVFSGGKEGAIVKYTVQGGTEIN